MKRIIGVILCSFIACAGALHSLAATEIVNGITWTYTVSNGVASLVGNASTAVISVSTTGVVTIPSSLGGCPVRIIGARSFSGCDGLTSVIIPSSVTNIEAYAFENCGRLAVMAIPNEVMHIGLGAFYGCKSLTEISLPFIGMGNDDSSVYRYMFGAIFGDSPFEGGVLTSQETPRYMSAKTTWDLYVPSALRKVIVTGTKQLGYGAFSGCSGLTSVTICNGVTSIEGSAFSGCSGLTSVTIPNSVTSIKERAFYGCNGLRSVQITDIAKWCGISFGSSYANPLYYAHNLYLNGEIVTDLEVPDGVTSIGDRAFYNCSGLTSVTIPDSVTKIGSSAFYGCSGLTSVTIPDSVTKIGSSAFYGCSGLTSVTIPDSVTSIGSSAFSGCSGLTNMTIPDSVISIGDRAFYGCNGLTSVTIPDSVTSIGSSAFYGCSGLTSVTMPNSITNIGSYAFGNCKELTSVKIPDSVVTIGLRAFQNCSGLTSMTIPDSVTRIGDSAFSGCCSLTNMVLPFLGYCRGGGNQGYGHFGFIFGSESYSGGVATKQYYDSDLSRYSTYFIPATLKTVMITDEAGFRYGAFSGCQNLTNITINEGVASIGGGMFFNCSGLTSVRIPDSVTIIGYEAFSGCSGLTSVMIPDGVTSIEGSAFSGCSGLTSVTMEGKRPEVGSDAFSGVPSECVVHLPRGNATYEVIDGKWQGMVVEWQGPAASAKYDVARDGEGGGYVVAAKDGETLVAGDFDFGEIPREAYVVAIASDGRTASVRLAIPQMGAAAVPDGTGMDAADPMGILVDADKVELAAEPTPEEGETVVALPVKTYPGLYYQAAWGGDLGSMSSGAKVKATGDSLCLGVIRQTGARGFYKVSVSEE